MLEGQVLVLAFVFWTLLYQLCLPEWGVEKVCTSVCHGVVARAHLESRE